MIEHLPYGIDDPYKSLPTERFPRDPTPGEVVQIGFRAEPAAAAAWVEVRHTAVEATGDGTDQRVEATALGDGLWTADIGPFDAGRVEYRLVAASGGGRHETADFTFAVGSWVTVTEVAAVTVVADRVVIGVRTDAG